MTCFAYLRRTPVHVRSVESRSTDQGMLETSTVTRTGLFLSSPTKGKMELVTGKVWQIKEDDLPEFEWVPDVAEITSDVQR